MVYKMYKTRILAYESIFVGAEYPGQLTLENQALDAILEENGWRNKTNRHDIANNSSNIKIEEIKKMSDISDMEGGWDIGIPYGPAVLADLNITVKDIIKNPMYLKMLDYIHFGVK